MGLRLWGLAFGSPAEHPDEIFLVVYPLNFFSGDLNPHSFHKPTFHFYLLGLLYAAYFIVGKVLGRDWTASEFTAYHAFFDTDSLLLLARLASVCFSTLTIWWVYRLVKRVGGEGAALAPRPGSWRSAFFTCVRLRWRLLTYLWPSGLWEPPGQRCDS